MSYFKFRFAGAVFFAFAVALQAVSLGSSTTRPSDLAATPAKPLRVAILLDAGADIKGYNFVTHCLDLGNPKLYAVEKVKGEDIRNGALDNADIAIFPGGSGSGQAKSLEPEGREKVRAFVKNGGGYLGICGGSYLATNDYPWSLNMVNAIVIDKKHWARGKATLTVDFTDLGKSLLGVPTDAVQCLYHQGPLMIPGKKTDLPAFETLATFATEVDDNNAPKGEMIGTNAMVRSIFGKGHVLLISPHPEQTDGLDYIIRSAVNWISHPETVANPLTGDQTNAAKIAALSPTTQAASAKHADDQIN